MPVGRGQRALDGAVGHDHVDQQEEAEVQLCAQAEHAVEELGAPVEARRQVLEDDIIFQYLPPGFYWGSELLYCVLSLSAKLYLGFFLLVNVIMTDGTVEGALAPADGQ